MASAAPVLEPSVLRFLQSARVAHLATVDAHGTPAVVPICFQVQDTRLFTPIDAKPKRRDWRRLQRVRNIQARPSVAVSVQRWDEDWGRLGWVHLRGEATLVEGGAEHTEGIGLLRAKYAQYVAMPLEQLPLIVVRLTGVTWWGNLE